MTQHTHPSAQHGFAHFLGNPRGFFAKPVYHLICMENLTTRYHVCTVHKCLFSRSTKLFSLLGLRSWLPLLRHNSKLHANGLISIGHLRGVPEKATMLPLDVKLAKCMPT